MIPVLPNDALQRMAAGLVTAVAAFRTPGDERIKYDKSRAMVTNRQI
jgi:hypothetical protein